MKLMLFTILAIVFWVLCDILLRIRGENSDAEHPTLKYAVISGMVYFVLAVFYIIVRDESITLLDSALKYWPVAVYAIVFSTIDFVTFRMYMYNEISISSPIANTSEGLGAVLIIVGYLVLGKATSLGELLDPFSFTGISLIIIGIVTVAICQEIVARKSPGYHKSFRVGAAALIFPILYALMDSGTIVLAGIFVDGNYGYAMPESDTNIFFGLCYGVVAFICWLYLRKKEGHSYNPFTKRNVPVIAAEVCDNLALLFYCWAASINSIFVTPLIAAYPVFVMIFSRIFLKERLHVYQYLALSIVVLGCVILVLGEY